MKFRTIDLSLVRASMIVNRKKVHVNYNRVNCYANALNISILPESVHLNLYNVGCFSGKNTRHLKTEDVVENLKSDLEALKVEYEETKPTVSSTTDDSWKIVLFVKLNKNCSLEERMDQIGGPNEVRDIHFVKIQDKEYFSKSGYNKPEKRTSYKQIKKEMNQNGYQYVKTYKLTIK